MGVPILRAVLSLGLTMLVLSLSALLFAPRDAPEFVPASLAVAVNLITVIGSGLVLRWLTVAQRAKARSKSRDAATRD